MGLVSSDRLREAAAGLLPFQRADGSWADPAETLVGSPVTYGATLATLMALRVVRELDTEEALRSARLAGSWLLAQNPVATLDRASRLMALQLLQEPLQGRRNSVEWLIENQGSSGGWGALSLDGCPKSSTRPS